MTIAVYEEDYCCDTALPKKMSTGYGMFGTYRATCSKCSFVCVYWECACELVHDCEDN